MVLNVLNLSLAEPVERTGQGFRNLLGSLVFDLPALEHEYDFPVLQQCDGRGRGRITDEVTSGALGGFYIGSGKNGCDTAGACLMLERQRNTGSRLACGAAAHRVHNNHERVWGFPYGGIDFSGSPQLFDTQLGQFQSHRFDEMFRIRHSVYCTVRRLLRGIAQWTTILS